MYKSKSVFLILMFLIVSSPIVYGQAKKQRVTLQSSNISFVKLFDLIEKQTTYRFSYRDVTLNSKKKISVRVKNELVEDVLNQFLPSEGLNYFIVSEKSIVITKKKKISEDTKEKLFLQGKVYDSNGMPIIGATVSLKKNPNKGTITSLDGDFELQGEINDIILISFVGYKKEEVLVKNRTPLRIYLKEDTELLDEVVVIGYGVQKKVNLSGAVSSVATKQIKNRSVMSTGAALQGTVANLNITVGSGQANVAPKFNIRGTTSLNGGSPLIIIDGIASNADQLNRMNSSDIENISILKDASSSAIYGSRAAFGVVLVTTKKGDTNKTTINYNNSFTLRKITQMPSVVTNPYQVAKFKNIMAYPWYNLYNEEQLAYAKKVSEDSSISPYFENPDGSYSYFGQTDWISETYKDSGFSTIHSVDLSGKKDNLKYYFSGNYNFQDGMMKYGTDTYNKYNLRSKLELNITKKWTISNNTSFVSSDYDSPTSLSSGTFREVNRINSMDVVKNPDGTWTQNGASIFGKLQSGGRLTKKKTNLRTQISSRLDLIKDVLFVQGNFAYSSDKIRQRWSYLPVSYYNGPKKAPHFYNEVSSAACSSSDVSHLTFDVYGTFNKTFAKKHTVNALIGFSQEDYRYEYTEFSRKNLISTSLPTPGLATGDMNVKENISTWTVRGAFSRLNYIFDDKYILEFNGRYDLASRFGKKSRSSFNPSASLAWIISKEKFFKPLSNVVSFMKLRASYGSLGNQDVSTYAYLATMGSGRISNIIDGKQPVYVSAPGLVSGNLTWEKVVTRNIGVDLNLFGNKLTTNFDYYIRETKDMLTSGKILPGVLGTAVPKENAADLETKGWELTIGWQDQFNLAGKPFRYNVKFNLADSRAYITKFDNPNKRLSQFYKGQELGEIWGLNTLGFFQSQEDIDNHADQSRVTSYPGTRPLAPGDLKFEDINKDGKIDHGNWTLENSGDYKVIGNSRSRYTFGLSLGADWNGFDLNLFIQGVGKKDYMPGAGDLYFWGVYSQPWTNITYGNMYDHWTKENPNAYFPRPKSYVADSGSKECGIPQTRYLQNAAYARLKNLTIGYTLPRSLTSKINISKLRVFFSGENLLEVSGLYKNYKVDPEGLGGQLYPFQRSYSLGLNLTF